ncbi:MAG: hypothetical protein ACW99A_05420 [Candidatus Kariarchaeaceae archaeon]|jgi:uncharacterized membrane protein YdbT with pleckstrin-like domain
MSISKTQGIFNFSKMKDKEKSYLVKLIGTIITAFVVGIISAVFYEKDGSYDGQTMGRAGFLIWFLSTLALTYWIKFKYDLSDWNDKRIFRHGVFVGFLNYLFWWTVVFNMITY